MILVKKIAIFVLAFILGILACYGFASKSAKEIDGKSADFGAIADSPDGNFAALVTTIAEKSIVGQSEYYYLIELHEKNEDGFSLVRKFRVYPTQNERMSRFTKGTGHFEWLNDSSGITVYFIGGEIKILLPTEGLEL